MKTNGKLTPPVVTTVTLNESDCDTGWSLRGEVRPCVKENKMITLPGDSIHWISLSLFVQVIFFIFIQLVSHCNHKMSLRRPETSSPIEKSRDPSDESKIPK